MVLEVIKEMRQYIYSVRSYYNIHFLCLFHVANPLQL